QLVKTRRLAEHGLRPAADVHMDGSRRTQPVLSQPTSLYKLTFDPKASGFLIGNGSEQYSIAIGAGGIINSSAYAQTIYTPINLLAPQTWSGTSRDLRPYGLINNNGYDLTVTGN